MMSLEAKESSLEGFKDLSVRVNDTTVSYGLVRHKDLEEILCDLQKDIDKVNSLVHNTNIEIQTQGEK